MPKRQFQANLPVTFLREGETFVAYTAALDLSTAGNTLEHAQARLAEAVQIFFEETGRMGTLQELLQDLGWTRQDNQLTPPLVVGQTTQPVLVPLPA